MGANGTRVSLALFLSEYGVSESEGVLIPERGPSCVWRVRVFSGGGDHTEMVDPVTDFKTPLRERMESMKESFGGARNTSVSIVVAVAEVYVSPEDMLGRAGANNGSGSGIDAWYGVEGAKWFMTLGRHLDDPVIGCLCGLLSVERLEDRLCCCGVCLLEHMLSRGLRGKNERRDEGRGDEPLGGDCETAGDVERKERLKLRNEVGV